MTPSTPVVPLIHGLHYTLEKIFEKALSIDIKGMHNSISWFMIGFQPKALNFFLRKFASKSLTCVKNNSILMLQVLLKHCVKKKAVD